MIINTIYYNLIFYTQTNFCVQNNACHLTKYTFILHCFIFPGFNLSANILKGSKLMIKWLSALKDNTIQYKRQYISKVEWVIIQPSQVGLLFCCWDILSYLQDSTRTQKLAVARASYSCLFDTKFFYYFFLWKIVLTVCFRCAFTCTYEVPLFVWSKHAAVYTLHYTVYVSSEKG